MTFPSMTTMGQEWSNTNRSLGSRISAETNGQESAGNGLAAFPDFSVVFGRIGGLLWRSSGGDAQVASVDGRPPRSVNFCTSRPV
jgi:hypothetical protein